MKDIEDAIAWFSYRTSSSVYMDGNVNPQFRKCHQDLLATIDSVLQKQVATTVKKESFVSGNQGDEHMETAYYCPSCNRMQFPRGDSWCRNCGQKLNWEAIS